MREWRFIRGSFTGDEGSWDKITSLRSLYSVVGSRFYIPEWNQFKARITQPVQIWICRQRADVKAVFRISVMRRPRNELMCPTLFSVSETWLLFWTMVTHLPPTFTTGSSKLSENVHSFVCYFHGECDHSIFFACFLLMYSNHILHCVQ